jgi:hypothetical protein
VSVFRPSVRVVAPDGTEWELYAYRIELPPRRRLLARVVLRPIWDVPRAGLRALRSDEWTIEALSFLPHRTAYAWRTTREFRGHVLAQVEGQLTRGETPTPHHATYLGASG